MIVRSSNTPIPSRSNIAGLPAINAIYLSNRPETSLMSLLSSRSFWTFKNTTMAVWYDVNTQFLIHPRSTLFYAIVLLIWLLSCFRLPFAILINENLKFKGMERGSSMDQVRGNCGVGGQQMEQTARFNAVIGRLDAASEVLPFGPHLVGRRGERHGQDL